MPRFALGKDIRQPGRDTSHNKYGCTHVQRVKSYDKSVTTSFYFHGEWAEPEQEQELA